MFAALDILIPMILDMMEFMVVAVVASSDQQIRGLSVLFFLLTKRQLYSKVIECILFAVSQMNSSQVTRSRQ